MNLATFRAGDRVRVGIVESESVLDVSVLTHGAPWSLDMIALIAAGPSALSAIREAARDAGPHSPARRPLASVQLLAPIPCPRKNIFCVGRNYLDHAQESARFTGQPAEAPQYPNYFSKPPTTVIGPDAPIPLHADVTQQLDYEVELGVVIGKPGSNIPETDAHEHIFGYTILNDVSARELQRRHAQWFKGKSLDGTCPIGPWIVPAEDIGDAADLDLSLRLNGQVMQSSNTGHMLFSIARLIHDLSLGTTLEPGDILATGTPSGVGFARQPPVFLKDGDVLELEIEGIGVLRNTVRA